MPWTGKILPRWRFRSHDRVVYYGGDAYFDGVSLRRAGNWRCLVCKNLPEHQPSCTWTTTTSGAIEAPSGGSTLISALGFVAGPYIDPTPLTDTWVRSGIQCALPRLNLVLTDSGRPPVAVTAAGSRPFTTH
jgi:hypothetical protein